MENKQRYNDILKISSFYGLLDTRISLAQIIHNWAAMMC